MDADSDEIYFMRESESPGFEYLKRYVDGQWYQLGYSRDNFSFDSIEFTLGGEERLALEGSIVQKYAYYRTCLEPGNYRVVLEMQSANQTPHY